MLKKPYSHKTHAPCSFSDGCQQKRDSGRGVQHPRRSPCSLFALSTPQNLQNQLLVGGVGGASGSRLQGDCGVVVEGIAPTRHARRKLEDVARRLVRKRIPVISEF
eukprot:6517173-Prymnesium_polylepis.1